MKRYLLFLLVMVATMGSVGTYAQTTKKTTPATKKTTTTAKKPAASTQKKTTTSTAKKTTTTTSTAKKTAATSTAKKAPAKTTTTTSTQSAKTTTQQPVYYNNKSNSTTTTTTTTTAKQDDSKYVRSGSSSSKSTKSSNSSSSSKPFRKDFKVKYMGEAHIGFTGKDVRTSQVRLGTMQGVSIGKYGDVGIGVDGSMFTGYPKGGDFPIVDVDPYFFMRPAFPITENFSVLLHTAFGVTIPVLNTNGDPVFEMEIGPGIRYKKLRTDLGVNILAPQGGSAVYPYIKVGLYF